MHAARLLRHVASDVARALRAAGYDDTRFFSYSSSQSAALSSAQAWETLTHLTVRYKALLQEACKFGSIHVPEIVDGEPITDFTAMCAVLNYHSVWVKLTFRGESTGLADYDGFIARSRECENFAGCSYSFLRLSNRDHVTIQKLTASRRTGRAKHGPGATFEKYHGWDKWLALEMPTHPVIRMTDVPKDRLKRRLIGIEHVGMQFLQQGIASELRSSRWFQWMTLEDQHAHVAFASKPGMCTIDLSDASDRIPLSLVEYLLPELYPVLAVASSAYAQTQDGSLHPLGMIATMGNGFCFELESLIFHIVASLAGRMYDDEILGPSRGIEYYADRCRVYGDDIIIPRQWLPAFEQVANQLGWVISWHKTGQDWFLETCGHYIDSRVGNALPRLCPSLQTADRTGESRDLFWDSETQRLSCASTFAQAGFLETARAIARPIFQKARFRWNSSFQRTEIQLSTMSKKTRPLNVIEETRYHAYWVSGLCDIREEDTGVEHLRVQWVPYRDFVHLASRRTAEKSATVSG